MSWHLDFDSAIPEACRPSVYTLKKKCYWPKSLIGAFLRAEYCQGLDVGRGRVLKTFQYLPESMIGPINLVIHFEIIAIIRLRRFSLT